MSELHSNISIFVPHIGCPHKCSFCNQVHITGEKSRPTAGTVASAVDTAAASKNYNPETTEIAFFGGSFTAIDKAYRLELLGEAYKFVKAGKVCGIRISTRPDAIDREILEELKAHGVTAIELGAQSMDDEVLRLNHRGHTREAVDIASRLIKAHGFSLGLQMMTGLLGDTAEKSIYTAEKIAELKPDTVRIYPTIVLKNTYLGELYEAGEYIPQALEEAVKICGKILPIFEAEGIKVIRLGLHTIEDSAFLAGPWHPAFGELVESERYRLLAVETLKKQPKGKYNLYVNPKEISKLVGQHRSNILCFLEEGYDCRVKPSADLDKYKILAESLNQNQGE